MKKKIIMTSFATLLLGLGTTFYLVKKSQTIDSFVSREALKRFPKVNLVGDTKLTLSEKMAQAFREKMLKQTIVSEELKKDPSLYFKAEKSLKQKGVLIADALVNGNRMKFLITEPSKCKISANQTIFINSKTDLNKVCNTEFVVLFSQLKSIDITFSTRNLDVIPEEIAMDWQLLIDESMQTMAINNAFIKSLKDSWL